MHKGQKQVNGKDPIHTEELVRAAQEAQKVWVKIQERRLEQQEYELRTVTRKVSPA